MRKFYDFGRADGHESVEHPLSNYTGYTTIYLLKNYNLNSIVQATESQIQEAAQYAAERWHEDENKIYENRK